MDKKFYVCSFGGSGSYLIQGFLKDFGSSYHIHTRNPPAKITKIKKEQFTTQEELDDANHFVIFIYSRPDHSLFSRASYGNFHWQNIGVEQEKLKLIPSRQERLKYFDMEKDLVDFDEFWSNYVFHKSEFPVLCLNFHHLWENLKSLFDFCEIPLEHLESFPKKREFSHKNNLPKDKNNLFETLNLKIELFPNSFIIPAK
tara:strand:+ start:776 stop:1375 length:600 start_codon:yes stop_codon:yes gene_type:complete